MPDARFLSLSLICLFDPCAKAPDCSGGEKWRRSMCKGEIRRKKGVQSSFHPISVAFADVTAPEHFVQLGWCLIMDGVPSPMPAV